MVVAIRDIKMLSRINRSALVHLSGKRKSTIAEQSYAFC
jgi:hypothetical protein